MKTIDKPTIPAPVLKQAPSSAKATARPVKPLDAELQSLIDGRAHKLLDAKKLALLLTELPKADAEICERARGVIFKSLSAGQLGLNDPALDELAKALKIEPAIAQLRKEQSEVTEADVRPGLDASAQTVDPRTASDTRNKLAKWAVKGAKAVGSVADKVDWSKSGHELTDSFVDAVLAHVQESAPGKAEALDKARKGIQSALRTARPILEQNPELGPSITKAIQSVGKPGFDAAFEEVSAHVGAAFTQMTGDPVVRTAELKALQDTWGTATAWLQGAARSGTAEVAKAVEKEVVQEVSEVAVGQAAEAVAQVGTKEALEVGAKVVAKESVETGAKAAVNAAPIIGAVIGTAFEVPDLVHAARNNDREGVALSLAVMGLNLAGIVFPPAAWGAIGVKMTWGVNKATRDAGKGDAASEKQKLNDLAAPVRDHTEAVGEFLKAAGHEKSAARVKGAGVAFDQATQPGKASPNRPYDGNEELVAQLAGDWKSALEAMGSAPDSSDAHRTGVQLASEGLGMLWKVALSHKSINRAEDKGNDVDTRRAEQMRDLSEAVGKLLEGAAMMVADQRKRASGAEASPAT